jgi:hypothetical protein
MISDDSDEINLAKTKIRCWDDEINAPDEIRRLDGTNIPAGIFFLFF